MRPIDRIVVHCSATEAGKDFRAADIDRWHRERGFNGIGYHYVVDLDGTIEEGRPLEEIGAHCTGYNVGSIGICYIGGLQGGNAADTRTGEQRMALHKLIWKLFGRFGITDICGHRDLSPDRNGDGKITPDEYIKDCPCFDVRAEYPIAICNG